MREKEVILVIHSGGEFTSIEWPESILEVNRISASNVAIHVFLCQLGRTFPEYLIGWCDSLALPYLNRNKLPQLIHHPYELVSYTPNNYLLDESIGYVDFNSPFIPHIPDNIRFGTWQVSSLVGLTSSQLIAQFYSLATSTKNLEIFLCAVTRQGMKCGLFSYIDPNLLINAAHLKSKSSIEATLHVIMNEYGWKWIIIYLLNIVFHKRNIPISVIMKCFTLKKYARVKLDPIPLPPSSKPNARIEVIIPTLGRSIPLRDVLLDLAEQTLKPTKVIVIEQRPGNEASELTYLPSLNLPFELTHRVIERTGACYARNLALRNTADCDWIFFADDDIRIPSNTLEDGIKECMYFGLNALTMAVFQKNETLKKEDMPILWNTFGTCSSLVKASFAKSTDFDLRLEFGYGEDTDYGNQLRMKGCNIAYSSKNPMLHLKAPIGGFRSKLQTAWSEAVLQPKPSPTVMYSFLKNHSEIQRAGYKFFLMYSRIMNEKSLNLYRFLKQWKMSKKWAQFLSNQPNTTSYNV